MTFTLNIDGARFEKQIANVIEDFKKHNARVVPVIKGNGYGFGRKMLAKEAHHRNLDRIAIGTIYELDQALTNFGGQIVVLEPFNVQDRAAARVWESAMAMSAHRVIATISNTNLLAATQAGIKQAFIEGKTSTHRFGVTATELLAILGNQETDLEILGLSLHLPIAQPVNTNVAKLEISEKKKSRKNSARVVEISNWINNFAPKFNNSGQTLNLSVSHISTKEVQQILDRAAKANHQISLDVRLGTSLWLGDPKALNVTGTVLEIHELTRDHEHVGYRQVDGHSFRRLLVVSGGTAHGVALAAPAYRSTLRSKGIAIVQGFAEAFGKLRSPFKLAGKNLSFAEPPHMHVSLLWCSDRKVQVGDQLECTVRNTTAIFDEVVIN